MDKITSFVNVIVQRGIPPVNAVKAFTVALSESSIGTYFEHISDHLEVPFVLFAEGKEGHEELVEEVGQQLASDSFSGRRCRRRLRAFALLCGWRKIFHLKVQVCREDKEAAALVGVAGEQLVVVRVDRLVLLHQLLFEGRPSFERRSGH